MLQTCHRSRALSLIYDIIALCPSGSAGLLFLSFPLCTCDKRIFVHSSPSPLDPAPLSLLVATCSIAWPVHAPCMYIDPIPSPGKLQSSLLGYFPGYTRLSLVISMRPVITSHPLTFSPHLAHARQSSDSQLHHLNSTTCIITGHLWHL